MSRYLLTCGCGQQLAIEPGQAGETLRCECGRPLAVPTLRELRQLPVARQETVATAATWGFRHGAMTVLVLAAIASLAAAGVSWWNQPAVPEFNPTGWTRMMDNQISELTPVAAWKAWVDTYEPLATTGFVTLEHPHTEAIEREIARRQWTQMILAAVAGSLLIAAIATALVGRVVTNK